MSIARRFVLIPLITFLVGGCADRSAVAPRRTDSQQNAIASRIADVPSYPQCPSQDFNVFLKAFANSLEVQKAFTQDPYNTVIDDDVHMDTGPEITELPRSQVEFPIMLGDKELVENGAFMESARKSDEWFQVSTHSQGTGAYSMTFNFHFQHGCWYLTDSLDTST